MLDDYGLTVSSLAYYPNPLHPDVMHREAVIAHLKKVIEGAEMLEVPVVGTFIGNDKNKTVHRTWKIMQRSGRQSSSSPKSTASKSRSRTAR